MEDIADKKKAIFESTLCLIREHGFHGAPMSLIAKNACVAAGTIYHYFNSKDQLINEMYVYNKSKIIHVVKEALAEDNVYKDKFFKIWMSLYEFYTGNPNVLIFFEQYINSPYNQEKKPDVLQERPLHDFFADGIGSGLMKPTKLDILLVLFAGSVSAAAKLHSFGHINLTKADLINIIEILWDGIATTPSAESKISLK